jgi:hypothetical protein
MNYKRVDISPVIESHFCLTDPLRWRVFTQCEKHRLPVQAVGNDGNRRFSPSELRL